jgi:hypothetical protein
MRKHPTAAPALLTAAPKIPCWTAKPKPNTKKTKDRDEQRRMRKLLAPLRTALEKAARQ